MSLGDGCLSKGIAIHEIMHTLGFYHEHTRRDRDRHVFVDIANTMEGKVYAMKVSRLVIYYLLTFFFL